MGATPKISIYCEIEIGNGDQSDVASNPLEPCGNDGVHRPSVAVDVIADESFPQQKPTDVDDEQAKSENLESQLVREIKPPVESLLHPDCKPSAAIDPASNALVTTPEKVLPKR